MCTATYMITLADIVSGSVINLATASANGVNSNPASVTVTFAPASPKIGSSMRWVLHDSLKVDGLREGAPNADDSTIVFKLYGPSDEKSCIDPIEGGDSGNLKYVETLTKVRTSGEYPTQAGFGIAQTAAGRYRWVVSYSGDIYNTGSTTACGDETHTITVGEPKPLQP